MATKIDLEELVMELNGRIMPIGSSEVDHDRLENLQSLCKLTGNLLLRIQAVAVIDSPFASISACADAAKKFIDSTK